MTAATYSEIRDMYPSTSLARSFAIWAVASWPMGSAPAGMLRVSMLTMLRRIGHEHLDAAVASVHGEGRKVSVDDLGRMRQELVDRLLVQISEHGLQVDCGYGERD